MKKKNLPKPTYEEIARCAFLIYETGGRQPGHDLKNWLEAEAQLIADRKPEVETDQQKLQQ